MPLRDRLKGLGAHPPEQRTGDVLWKGPVEDGITFSLLSRFLCCRERFRLLVVEGLKSQYGFNHRAEYGNLWHECERALSAGVNWRVPLRLYAQRLAKEYPTDGNLIDHWYSVCKVQFPIYVAHWAQHEDNRHRRPLLQEAVFNVPYLLPSGRVVRLRGKWDAVDLIGKGSTGGVYLQENKTKGDIREEQLKRQLTFDLQTMLYLVAIREAKVSNSAFWRDNQSVPKGFSTAPLAGVRYNVVRRPLSGGKYTIVRHKPRGSTPAETKDHFYGRLAELIIADAPHFFMRWKVEVWPADIRRFEEQCLHPILEQLCDWWNHIENCPRSRVSSFHPSANEADPKGIHWRHPYGVFNILDEGGVSDLDEHLHTGGMAGLRRVNTLFGELE